MRQIAMLGLAAALVGAFAGITTADAQSHRYSRQDASYVTAESRYGHGTVTGPVRIARAGNREVRLPGGTWISCTRSCAETLRIESVDFWENKGAGRGNTDNSCGIFGCLNRSYGF